MSESFQPTVHVNRVFATLSGRRAGRACNVMSDPLLILVISTDASFTFNALDEYGIAHSWQRVSNSLELRAALETVLWDVVLLDLEHVDAPAMNTLEAIHSYAPDLQVIGLTATENETAALAALQAGVRDVVSRAQTRRLALLCERATSEWRMQRELRQNQHTQHAEALQAKILVRAATRLRSAADRGTVISVICEEAVRGLEASMVCVALPGPHGRLEIVGCAGENQHLIGAALVIAERRLAGASPRRLTERGWVTLDSHINFSEHSGWLIAMFADPAQVPGASQRSLLNALAEQAGSALDSAALRAGLEASNAALKDAFEVALEGWVRALDVRAHEAVNHTRRVTTITMRLAEEMGISGEALTHVRRGALLHDIGMFGVPEHILHKPGPLDDAEWEPIRRHPNNAYEWLSSIPLLAPALDIPYCHHERWDGGGYPRCLHGANIPLPARIFAVADTWDALRTQRPYKPAYSETKALQIMTAESGQQFDPQVMRTFLRLLPELRAA